ncbi:hypothetical protein CPB83DRAFT_893106 [Crepidotus variabilis]|uniref:N-acetyltransferase domain-containing protein n=1 Tax=Crepidotus variabilis TaxID=179855 RepID=A0A9P6EJ70_9AGAR|nr:hypothetical protein CPB83DRAFT_893106 [Crepidotus variabilis]
MSSSQNSSPTKDPQSHSAEVKPYVRMATLEEAETLSAIAGRSFIHDPVFNYFNQIDHLLDPTVDEKEVEERRVWFSFLTKACFLVGGRVTVVVDPNENDKIVSAALWLPPKKRLAVWMVPTLFRAGVIPVLKNWGLTGLLVRDFPMAYLGDCTEVENLFHEQRIVLDYQDTAEKTMETCFKKTKKIGSAHNAWYLQLTFTDPDYYGKGFMSMLVREAFDHTPEATFVLEATTPKSRNMYAHLGFQNPTPINFGVKKADRNGLNARGEAALGVEIWAMAKVRDKFPSYE